MQPIRLWMIFKQDKSFVKRSLEDLCDAQREVRLSREGQKTLTKWLFGQRGRFNTHER